jgi:hypothetical protein
MMKRNKKLNETSEVSSIFWEKQESAVCLINGDG